jgi:hypothetical protein
LEMMFAWEMKNVLENIIQYIMLLNLSSEYNIRTRQNTIMLFQNMKTNNSYKKRSFWLDEIFNDIIVKIYDI